jgi:hypothetical protein
MTTLLKRADLLTEAAGPALDEALAKDDLVVADAALDVLRALDALEVALAPEQRLKGAARLS